MTVRDRILRRDEFDIHLFTARLPDGGTVILCNEHFIYGFQEDPKLEWEVVNPEYHMWLWKVGLHSLEKATT